MDIKKIQWGELATSALIVSIISGLIVAYQYEVSEPFISTVAIDGLLPFGRFFRALHFYSSQFFVAFVFIHTFVEIKKRDISSYPPWRWFTLTMLLPASVFALFTGYVLRYDATGQSAGAIAEHLIAKVPFVGHILDRFMIAIPNEGLNRVYLLHIILTVILWGLGTWYHTKKPIVSKTSFKFTVVLSIATAVVFSAPMDEPGLNVTLIKGPWFFLAVQELLRYIPPIFAGIIYPITPVVILAFLPRFKDQTSIWLFLYMWLISYIVCMLIMWLS